MTCPEGLQKTVFAEAPELDLNRRLRDLRQIARKLERSNTTPLQICEAIIRNRVLDLRVRSFFLGLPEDEKHYWISSLYALLMPKSRRRRLAAYFTPPHLAHYAIDCLIDAGIQPGTHRILDPASGGAAFLVPLAARIAKEARRRRARPESILHTIESTLAGVEIEPHLASLSKALLAGLLRNEINAAGRNLNIPITRANTLELLTPATLYDAVVGNPPYGRVYRPSKTILRRFTPVITDSYVNLYVLFLEQAIQWTRPGGVICLVVPVSFIGGPLFAALRKRILETSNILRLDLIDKRSDVFLDVLYDVCVLLLQKKGTLTRPVVPTSSLLMLDCPPRLLGSLDLPRELSDRVWGLPDGKYKDQLFETGLETLQDYGYITKAGYFVWNREQHRYRTGQKPRSNEVPLFWAHNVCANVPCTPSDGHSRSQRVGFVKILQSNTAIVRSDAIILQRTTNRHQKRRLIAAVIRKARLPGKAGFVSENHTILIIPDRTKKQTVPLSILRRLLNTAAVDARFRRISGSVSVSTKALRHLPLPAATRVCAAFKKGVDDDDAADTAYTRSTHQAVRKSIPVKETG